MHAKSKETPENIILEYHERTRHQLDRYARGPDSLDWDMQPNPFREFRNSKRISLPLSAQGLEHSFNEIHIPGCIKARDINLESIGLLFELSMGLSAWKVYGPDRWALRCNPSSGNLHPTESYLLLNTHEKIEAGVYHYLSHDHCLEQRCDLSVATGALDEIIPPESLLVGLTSVHWRESWKYGERAYRYCQLDIGHAIASIRYAAALLGWHVSLLEHWGDKQIASILGTDRIRDFDNTEKETPDAILFIQKHKSKETDLLNVDALIDALRQGEWKGQANLLSPDGHLPWPIIDKVSDACYKPETKQVVSRMGSDTLDFKSYPHRNASEIIRQRRSAQAFDGQSTMSSESFFRILKALLPGQRKVPFDCLPWTPRIHPVFYIHRVEGIQPGLYALPRSEEGKTVLQKNLRDEFLWQRPEQCPDDLPLYLLVNANCRSAARTVSCHQAIASDGAFAVSMLAEFDNYVNESPWRYRQLYWEAGLVGQVLYLESEVFGMRGTGIGCFFDDKIHEIMGIENRQLQCLYNFTIGMPLLDNRLVSLPPYSHLK